MAKLSSCVVSTYLYGALTMTIIDNFFVEF